MYDPACGTGVMLSVAENYLRELNPRARLEVFGQEVNPESYAICKSDMLIKGQNTANIKFGNSFTMEGLESKKFDYMLSNPPFGVEWIREVSEHWEVKRLKYVATINPTKENSKISKDSDELVTFLPMEKVNEDGTFATDLKRSINELWNGFTYFEACDTIFAKITPCFENGKGIYLINLGSRVGFGSTEFHVLREIANTSISKYLYYITRFDLFRKSGESLMIDVAGQKRVPSTFAENFLIGIPPVLEQQSITAYLDRKTVQVDNLISKKQKLIELLKEERAAIINQTVTKGLKPDAPMKDSRIEWLGEIPAHWEVKKMKWVSKIFNGSTPKSSIPEYWDGHIVWVTPADISKNSSLKISESEKK